MATQDLLKYVNEQVRECAICMHAFNNPKTLPCLHVFCSDCIGKHINIHERKQVSMSDLQRKSRRYPRGDIQIARCIFAEITFGSI